MKLSGHARLRSELRGNFHAVLDLGTFWRCPQVLPAMRGIASAMRIFGKCDINASNALSQGGEYAGSGLTRQAMRHLRKLKIASMN